MHISFVDSAAAAAFGILLALVATAASAQCDPSECTNPNGEFKLKRLPPPARAEPLCPLEPVVWVNTKSRVYYVAGSRSYGHTRYGAYMCETEAKSAGNRAAPH